MWLPRLLRMLSLGTSGSHTSTGRLPAGKLNASGITPTTVRATPSRLIVWPTRRGSPPKRRRQKPSPRTTTPSRPG
jgi:hypothetical protein